jgi:hypothetical protein
VTRGPNEITSGTWLVIDTGSGPARVGQIQELVEISFAGCASSVVRLWCDASRALKVKADGGMWSPHVTSALPAVPMLVVFESVQVTIVVISKVCVSHDEFM